MNNQTIEMKNLVLLEMYVSHQTYDNPNGKTHDYSNREMFSNFYNKGENTNDVLQAILWREKL